VQRASTTTTHAATVTIQNKAQSFTEQTPRNDFIPLAIKTYNSVHCRFDSFLTSCVHANIARHQQTFLVPSMLISQYRQQVSIALQHSQAIMILQRATTFNHSSSFSPHIATSALPSLADLC
jgi:hypothetical protein